MTDRVTEQELQQALTAWGRQRDAVALLHEGWQAAFSGHAVLIHELVTNEVPHSSLLSAFASLDLDGADSFAAAVQDLARCARRYEELKSRFNSEAR